MRRFEELGLGVQWVVLVVVFWAIGSVFFLAIGRESPVFLGLFYSVPIVSAAMLGNQWRRRKGS